MQNKFVEGFIAPSAAAVLFASARRTLDAPGDRQGRVPAGVISEPATITFLALSSAANYACR